MMDEAIFREWWTQVFPGVRRSIVSIVGSESIDILQDVSLMAIQRFDEFEDFETFSLEVRQAKFGQDDKR